MRSFPALVFSSAVMALTMTAPAYADDSSLADSMRSFAASTGANSEAGQTTATEASAATLQAAAGSQSQSSLDMSNSDSSLQNTFTSTGTTLGTGTTDADSLYSAGNMSNLNDRQNPVKTLPVDQ